MRCFTRVAFGTEKIIEKEKSDEGDLPFIGLFLFTPQAGVSSGRFRAGEVYSSSFLLGKSSFSYCVTRSR